MLTQFGNFLSFAGCVLRGPTNDTEIEQNIISLKRKNDLWTGIRVKESLRTVKCVIKVSVDTASVYALLRGTQLHIVIVIDIKKLHT